MSSGQKPRWPQYFPRMKCRGKGRPRPMRMVVYDERWRPIWPPVLNVGGRRLRADQGTLRFTGQWGTRELDRRCGRWVEVDADG